MHFDDSIRELNQVLKQLTIKNKTRLLERAYILLEEQNEEKLHNKKK